jgi:hypothetical protein
MKAAKTIEVARGMLSTGNGEAYSRILAAEIRATSGKRAAQVRNAIVEDNAQRFFLNLNSKCPMPAERNAR